MEVTPKFTIDRARDLRQRQTPTEARLWAFLRRNSLNGLGFRRQRPVGRFIADFCCQQAWLIVEVDGDYHDDPEQRGWDEERTQHFTEWGYRVVRFSNDEILTQMPSVLARIRDAAR